MVDSDEYFMDFESEIQQAHFTDMIDIPSDCSTLSASEIASDNQMDTTPPLFFKLKKARVLIKKLPRDVLKKYNISYKKSSLGSQPSRSSGRIKGKHIPVGQYLALHKNEPLNKIIRKQKIQSWKSFKSSNAFKFKEKDNSEKQKWKPISSDYSACSSINRTLSSTKPSRSSNSLEKNISKKKSPSITTTPVMDISKTIPTNRSLHERIAVTRIINKYIETPLPILPDVVITRYDVPPTFRNNPLPNVAETVPMGQKRLKNVDTLSKSLSTSYPKLPHPRNVQSKVFPAFITSAYANKQNLYHATSSNPAVMASNDELHRRTQPSPRKFTIQAFKVPNDSSKANSLVPVDSPKEFVVDNSSLEIDPLDTPSSQGKFAKTRETDIRKENTIGNYIGIRDSDLKKINAEKQIEPEVIKRIIYHTKSVQTKFTCNSSICGLVDTNEFNLNCFYCYDTFPLDKWYEFKEHIKVVHQVEESCNLEDSDANIGKSYSQKCVENVSQHMNSTPRYERENGKAKFTKIRPSNTTQHVGTKLPLEPKLVAQRQYKIIEPPTKLLSSTPKDLKNSKTENQSRNSEKFFKSKFTNFSFNTSQIDEVISLDSDECEIVKGDLNDVRINAKGSLQSENKNAHKQLHTDKKATGDNNNTKIVLPTLPHITIKKIRKASSAEKFDTTTNKASKSIPLKENFIKIPCSTNIKKVIKTVPKQTAKQLSDNVKTKPRYFVVKKIIKLPTSDQVPDLNIQKGTILTKIQMESNKNNNTNPSVSRDSTEKVEDTLPKPASGVGVGILFGITNSMVVIEFLLKLKTYPELWRDEVKNSDPVKYNESMKKLCLHINNRFDLSMTNYEVLLSIQRVKDWYHLMLQSIQEHNKDPNKTETYKHRFPIYFKILSQYLTPDTDEKGILLDEIINKMKLKDQNPQPTTVHMPAIFYPPNRKDNSQNPEVVDDSLIEFDADTLYDQESSAEEILEEFDESSIFFRKKPLKRITKGTLKVDGTPKSRTKIYIGSFECDICHKVYKRNCDLKRHKVHHLPPQFECGRCSQKFYLKHWAERCTHIKNYSKYKKVDKASGEKRIWPKKIFRFNMICEICGNSYRSIGSLNTHKRDKHFNQRDKCIVCNFTALSNWRIVQHQKKRHIVEPGLPEDVAKKSRARTECKTSFSHEARQAFDWRREMRKKLNPGEKFYGCCRCKILFNTRKEKVFHNKIEHPITEYTVLCLLCLPNKLILANANSARRHYTVAHKVAWHEIDALVKCTKPIFNFLNMEEIELLKASENYKELLDELLKDKKLVVAKSEKSLEDEVTKAVENLTNKKELNKEDVKLETACTQEENVYVDGIIDHNHSDENNYKQTVCSSLFEHNYSEEQAINENFDDLDVGVGNQEEHEFYSQQSGEERTVTIFTSTESASNVQTYIQNDEEHAKNIVEDFFEGELVEESIVVEEYIDEIIDEDDEEFVQI